MIGKPRQSIICPLAAGSARPSRMAGGFTLVELLTACMIVSIALLGVYAIFRNSVQTERRLSLAWQDRQAAEAIVREICRAVESAIEIPPIPAMKTGKEADGRPFLDCLTYGDSSQMMLQRRRYRWDGETGVIDLRAIVFSGSQPVSMQPQGVEDPWANIEPATIGRGLTSLSIQFKTAASDKWQGKYARSDMPAIVRVKASVGKATVERITSCPLTAALEVSQ